MKIGLVGVGIVCALGVRSFADAPGWSRGQQELPIAWEDCVKRAGGALQAEGYRVDQPSPFAVGIKGVHTAVIMCNPSAASKMWVNIVVASNGEGGGSERQRLQARMEGSTPANPPPPPPPTVATGREGCQASEYSLRVEPTTVRINEPFVIHFRSKGRIHDKDWITFHKISDPPEKYYYNWGYAVDHTDTCTFKMSFSEPGTYGLAYLLDNGTERRASATITITAATGAQSRVEPPQPPTPPQPPAKEVKYLGCFKDSNNPFDLDGYVERSRQNTPQRCIQVCAAKGFAYAGVQYSESCLCGNRYGTQGQAANCNMACTGDPKTTCGGGNANSVYSTGR